MKKYDFVHRIKLDARSKIPLRDQLRREISQAILTQKLPPMQVLPSVAFMVDRLSIPEADVVAAMDDLVVKKMLKKSQDVYHVTYKEFIYDISEDYRGILEAITLNGFTPVQKNHPAEIIPKSKVKSIHPSFQDVESLYLLRVDYYADDTLFAITHHYFPTWLSNDIDGHLKAHGKLTELFAAHIDHLTQHYTTHAILYPDWVSEAFAITPGQAGTLIENEYRHEGTLYLYYQAYVTNQYTLMKTHSMPTHPNKSA